MLVGKSRVVDVGLQLVDLQLQVADYLQFVAIGWRSSEREGKGLSGKTAAPLCPEDPTVDAGEFGDDATALLLQFLQFEAKGVLEGLPVSTVAGRRQVFAATHRGGEGGLQVAVRAVAVGRQGGTLPEKSAKHRDQFIINEAAD